MKIQSALGVIAIGLVLAGCTSTTQTEPVAVHQQGLVEATGSAAIGTAQVVGEFATGVVAGNTTVVQTNGAANALAAAPASVVQAPVAVAPATPLMPYGAYYTGYYGYRHCYNPYRYGGWGCAVNSVTYPAAVANPVAPIVVNPPPAVVVPAPAATPEPLYVSAPAPRLGPAVVAPYGRAGRVFYYGF